MYKVLLKHIIYENAINIMFAGISRNFIGGPTIADSIKLHDKLDFISIRFQSKCKPLGIEGYALVDMMVFDVDNTSISIKSCNDSNGHHRIESIAREDIIEYRIKC
jgi:hypothetical protein